MLVKVDSLLYEVAKLKVPKPKPTIMRVSIRQIFVSSVTPDEPLLFCPWILQMTVIDMRFH